MEIKWRKKIWRNRATNETLPTETRERERERERERVREREREKVNDTPSHWEQSKWEWEKTSHHSNAPGSYSLALLS